MYIRRVEESIRNQRYELALDFAARALASIECEHHTENTIMVLGYKLHCLVKLDLFKQAAAVSDSIHEMLTQTYNFPHGDYPERRDTPDQLLAFLSSFAADYCLSVGDSTRAETFLEAAIVYANAIQKNIWLDEYIVDLTLRLIDGNIRANKIILERLYKQ